MIRLFLAALLLITLPALLEARANPPTGLWLTEKQGVIVRLYECGPETLCGRTVWIKKKTFKDGSPRLDAKNPDSTLRDRPWCGIEVITGLRPDGEGGWDKGKVYDPKTGRTFDFRVERTTDGLKARGYLGAPFLGKTERWTAADPADLTFCDPV